MVTKASTLFLILILLAVLGILILFMQTLNSNSLADEYGLLRSDKFKCMLPNFVGRLNVDLHRTTFQELAKKWGNQSEGSYFFDYNHPEKMQYGFNGVLWSPISCQPVHRTAIIVPFRNRHENLSLFLNHYHPYLRHQKLAYTIFVIEQNLPINFNRAALFNVGFIEAMKLNNYSCLIFHDVDLLSEDDRNLYICGSEPIHFSSFISKHKYRLIYKNLFGGVVGLSPNNFRKVQGFPNSYFGWGGEDDDMSMRVRQSGLRITRKPIQICRYKTIIHSRESGNLPNPKRKKRLSNAQLMWKNDTYKTIRYTILNRGLAYDGIYMHIKVNILT